MSLLRLFEIMLYKVIKMKRLSLFIILIIILPHMMSGQNNGNLVSNCVGTTGPKTTYLKDYVIKLPKASSKTSIPVVKENFPLSKGTNYRFTICNSEGSAGQLILTIFERDQKILSSFNEKTGKIYNSVDFACNKTGTYTFHFSFSNGEQGMGVGVVSFVR